VRSIRFGEILAYLWYTLLFLETEVLRTHAIKGEIEYVESIVPHESLEYAATSS
jgi:hypothetical protein